MSFNTEGVLVRSCVVVRILRACYVTGALHVDASADKVLCHCTTPSSFWPCHDGVRSSIGQRGFIPLSSSAVGFEQT